jgi:UDP-glucuronate decarboxylase
VVDLVDPSAQVVYEPLPQDDPQRRRPDIARARDVLGWQPRVSLREGLGPTIAWFRSAVGPVAARRPPERRKGARSTVLGAGVMRQDV